MQFHVYEFIVHSVFTVCDHKNEYSYQMYNIGYRSQYERNLVRRRRGFMTS